ncbi:MAG: replication protein [Patescibacteria group bacterium]|nr:replication protein [Patescibacteria group bacterium]
MENKKHKSILPNTTQVPHLIIRTWMPRLKDTELRILLVITDQTLGWIEDRATGRRKEQDWISHYQLCKKSGRASRSVSRAAKVLIEKHRIVGAYDEQGNALDTAGKRQKCGYRIYYRLALHLPPMTIFDTPAKSAGVADKHLPLPKVRSPKVRTTKVTVITKGVLSKKDKTLRTAEPIASKSKNLKENKRSLHSQFIEFWHETTQRARGIKPVITGKDARNLKRVLDMGILNQYRLEQLAAYFLAHPTFRKFSPSIATFLSAGILNGLMNRMENDPNFWKELEVFAMRHLKPPSFGKTFTEENPSEMIERLARLKAKLFKEPFTPAERTKFQEEAAVEERAART